MSKGKGRVKLQSGTLLCRLYACERIMRVKDNLDRGGGLVWNPWVIRVKFWPVSRSTGRLIRMIQVCRLLAVKMVVLSFGLSGCSVAGGAPALADKNLQTSEALIDAFYSFDADQLRPLLADAKNSAATLIFYQGWAEVGNYRVLQRQACVAESDGVVSCAITVEDDPVLALNIDFNVTDTFRMTYDGATLVAVENSSNDQPVYFEAYNWVVENMPEVMAGPCQGFFDGGPTPGDCARAMTIGYRKFARLQP